MIVCCGDALIDFLPVMDRDGQQSYRPVAGGSVLNVAITLGRLGAPVTFLGGVSADLFGDVLIHSLDSSNVSTTPIKRSPRPTTLAFVDVSTGEPAYAFFDERSACRTFDPVASGPLPADATALHFGSFPLGTEPVGSRLAALLKSNTGRLVISLDPNVRPALVEDAATYRARMDEMTPLADIVKASVADITWLYPGLRPEDVARRWLDRGTALVVITRGGDGATGMTRKHSLEVPIVPVEIADTIGAGDAFMGAMLARLHEQGLLDRDGIRRLDRDALSDTLAFAGKVAAITCTRAGANPPRRQEITAEL